MSTNSNLQQINVFNKGMNTDTSDAYLSNELYRYAENLRFITDTGENSGELRSIEGYLQLNDILNEQEEVIAVTSIRNLIIILSNDPHALIHVVDIDGKLTDWFPFSDDLFDWDEKIKYSLVTRWESENNIKLYIEDGVNELMSLNIMKPDGYYNSIKMISGVSNDYLNKIYCYISAQEGNIMAPLVLYCYYLYTEGSVKSDLSPLSDIIKFDKLSENESSGKAVDIYVNARVGTFKKIKIFRIEYVKNGATPNVYIAVDSNLSDSAFTYTDFGSQVYSVSFSEFQSLNKLHLKSRLIESKGDYLFLAKIQDVSQDINERFKDVIVTYNVVDSDINYQYLLDFEGDFVQYGYDDETDTVITDKEKYGLSLMIGETYRYGFVYYTNDGLKTSVLNITDVVVDDNKSFVKEIITTSTNHNPLFPNAGIKFNRIGVRFTILNLPEDCIGYDIVRCERTIKDSNTITQGILGCTFGNDDGNFRYASSFMSLLNIGLRDTGRQPSEDFSDTWHLSGMKSQSDLSMFASPESSYQMDDTINALNMYKAGLKIKELKRYNIRSSSKNLSAFNSRLPIRFLGGLPYYDFTELNSLQGLYISHKGERSVLFYYISPKDDTQLHNLSGNIYEIAAQNSPGRFDDGQSIQIGSDTTVVDNFEFINWDAWYLFKNGNLDTTQWPYDNISSDNMAYSISSGKKCILLKSDISKLLISDSASGLIENNLLPVSVVNILKINTDPYGGFSDEAKKQNVFYSYGNFFVKSSEAINVVDVYDGDVYNCLFVYNSSHCWDSKKYSSLSNAVVYSIPVQTRVDLMQRTGDLWPDLKSSLYSYFFQDDAGKYGGLVLDEPAYVYNTAYSLGHTARSSYVADVKTIDSSLYDTRIYYSDPKTNGELIDSWTNFKAMNFLDVDSRYGEITDLRLFKNSLVFWLKNAVGVLAVNERTMLQDVNDTNIILGNGDVLQRYDYLSTKYGMAANLLCDTQSDNVLYWWDEDNKDLIMYPGGLSVLPMKINKSVSNIINKGPINHPTLAYDNKYKEIMFSSVDNKTLVYNELIQLFTSMYTIDFLDKVQLGDRLLLINKEENLPYKILLWNENEAVLTPTLKYVVNDKNTFIKVFDNILVGMGELFFYKGETAIYNPNDSLSFNFKTVDLKSECENKITNREYDLRLAIPRHNDESYGNRMRGKTMQCELKSSSTDFSLLYIITKYRILWS